MPHVSKKNAIEKKIDSKKIFFRKFIKALSMT